MWALARAAKAPARYACPLLPSKTTQVGSGPRCWEALTSFSPPPPLQGLLPVTEELHLITFTLDYKYQDVELQLQVRGGRALPDTWVQPFNVCEGATGLGGGRGGVVQLGSRMPKYLFP